MFGLRQLTAEEVTVSCLKNASVVPLMNNKHATFTSNYRLRIFTSACYYLDENNHWQSAGLVVRFRFLTVPHGIDNHLLRIVGWPKNGSRSNTLSNQIGLKKIFYQMSGLKLSDATVKIAF